MMYKQPSIEVRQCNKTECDLRNLRDMCDAPKPEGLNLVADRLHVLTMKIIDRPKTKPARPKTRKLDIAALGQKPASAKALSGIISMLTVLTVSSLVFVPLLLAVESQKPGPQGKLISQNLNKLIKVLKIQ